VVSFVTVTELRYGAIKAEWGELRRRSLERDLARLVIVQPDDETMQECADLRACCERAGPRPLRLRVGSIPTPGTTLSRGRQADEPIDARTAGIRTNLPGQTGPALSLDRQKRGRPWGTTD